MRDYLEGEEVTVPPVDLKPVAVIPCDINHKHLRRFKGVAYKKGELA